MSDRVYRNELWGIEFPGTAAKPGYMQLYNASVLAVKAVDPSLKVGGPATAGLADLPAFVAACATMGLPKPDFVSSHHYPTDGKSGPTPMQQACPSQQVGAVETPAGSLGTRSRGIPSGSEAC